MEINGEGLCQAVLDVVCDVCGASCTVEKEFIESSLLSADWGCGTERDGICQRCDLCPACWDRVCDFIEGLGGKVRTIEVDP